MMLNELMDKHENPTEDLPRTPAELLRRTSDECSRLDKEAGEALRVDMYGDRYLCLVRQRAQIVADLPTKLNEMRESGVEIPEEVDTFVSGLAEKAKSGIDEDSHFIMKTVITPDGSREANPDVLLTMAQELETPNET